MHLPVAPVRGAVPPVFKLKPLAPIALAAALALWALPGQAGISTTGSTASNPPGALLGPGDTVAPAATVIIGSGGVGSLQVDGGSFLQLANLSFGNGGTGNGSGLLTGAGSRVELVGNGTGS